MDKTYLFMVIGMGLVTYLPRMLPFVTLERVEFPPFIRGVLKNVPFAILGALIFPGVLFIHDHPAFGLIGLATAFLIAMSGANVIFVVLGSILVLTGVSFFF
jgi:Branched-chain amino acid transport protein (AzlD).